MPRSVVVGPALEDAVLNEVVEPFGEYLPGDPQVLLDLLESSHPDEHVAQDERGPGLATTSSVRAIEHAISPKFVRCIWPT